MTSLLDPDAAAFVLLGEEAQRAGRDGPAERWYAEALRVDPGHAPARFNRGVALLRLGRAGEAREELARLLGPSDWRHSTDPYTLKVAFMYALACASGPAGENEDDRDVAYGLARNVMRLVDSRRPFAAEVRAFLERLEGPTAALAGLTIVQRAGEPRHEGAAELAGYARRERGDDARTLHLLAAYAAATGALDEALETLRGAVARDPSLAPWVERDALFAPLRHEQPERFREAVAAADRSSWLGTKAGAGGLRVSRTVRGQPGM